MSTSTTTDHSDLELTPWWLVLIEGIALIILGLLLLANPRQTSVIVVQVLGLYWLLAGILSIVKIFIDSSSWGWKLFTGIVGIIAGFLVLQHPLWSTLIVGNALIILIGIFGIVIGAINLYHAFKGAGWGTGILGVISILLGIVLLANVWLFRFSLPWVIGLLSLFGGIAAVVGAFRMKSEEGALEASRSIAPPSEKPVNEVATKSAEEVEAVADEVAPETVAPEEVMAAPATAAAVAGAVVAEEVIKTKEASSEEPAPTEMLESKEPDETPEKPAVTGQAALTHDLSYIEGVGTIYAESLMEAGIDSPQTLLEKGATPKGRAELAEKTGISGKLILTWVNEADLYRIKGVGAQYADLLEAAGVDTVPELARRNPANLHKKLTEVNEEKNLVRHVPAQSQVEEWVEQAKTLPRKITY